MSEKVEKAKIENAVLYCRTASVSSSEMENPVNPQEEVCREYAENNGYHIEQVFTDKGVSGLSTKRSGFDVMISYLQKNGDVPHIVIVSDLNVLARGADAFKCLKQRIESVGGRLKVCSLNSCRKLEHAFERKASRQVSNIGQKMKNRSKMSL